MNYAQQNRFLIAQLSRLFMSVTLIIVPLCINAQISINGMRGHYDRDNFILFSIPEVCFNDTYTAIITYSSDKPIDNICIDGTIVNNNDNFEFKSPNGNKIYTMATTYVDKTIDTSKIYFTHLPIIHLYGNFGYEYKEGFVDVCMPGEKDETVDMYAKLKWRGGSTNSINKNKRNYHIKFLKKNGNKKNRTFFGYRNDNDWLLDACQIDYARCRNRIATELWQDFTTPPYYLDISAQARSYVRGKMVEVFLNDEYRGIYAFTEAMDRKQMGIVDYDFDNNTFHGLMWKSKSWTNATMMYGVEDYDNYKDNWMGFEVESPDFDDVCPTDYSLLYDAINFVSTCSDKDFASLVTEYFDVPVLIDYYLFLHLIMAPDNSGKNMYWACNDQNHNKRLTIAIWDLDVSFGQTYNPADYHPTNMGPEINFDNQWNSFNLLKKLVSIPKIKEMAINRYWELRNSCFSTDSLIQRFTNCIEGFISSGASWRETQKWSGNSDLAGNPLDFVKELNYITHWIDKRCKYLDEEVFPQSLSSIYDVTNVKDNTNNIIYNLQGQRINSTSNLHKGIYIKNGKKFFIK